MNTDFGSVHYVEYGGTGHPIVLIHGLGGSTTNWNAIAPRLTRHGRVLAMDLPGFGLSPPGRDYSLRTHQTAIEAFLAELGEPATLVGNSTGGLLSEMVASGNPQLVDRQVLVAPATPPKLPDGRLHWPTVARLVFQATPLLGESYGRWFIANHSPEELVSISLEMITHHPGNVPLSLVEDTTDIARVRKHLPWAVKATARTATSVATQYARRAEFIRMVRKITAPTLVVQGESDHIVSPTAVEWLCWIRPDWELVQLDHTGHTPQMDAWPRTTQIIDQWLAGSKVRAQGA